MLATLTKISIYKKNLTDVPLPNLCSELRLQLLQPPASQEKTLKPYTVIIQG